MTKQQINDYAKSMRSELRWSVERLDENLDNMIRTLQDIRGNDIPKVKAIEALTLFSRMSNIVNAATAVVAQVGKIDNMEALAAREEA